MIPGFKWDNGNPLYVVALLEYLLKRSYLFEDDPSLSYELPLIGDAMQLFMDYRGVLGRCGFPDDWYRAILNEAVLGAKIELPSEFFDPDASGEIVISVSQSNGVISIG